MALLPARRARILERISKYESQLADIDTALEGRLSDGSGYVASYNFSDGQGSQQVSYTRVADLHRQQEMLEAQLDRLYRKLDGTGLATIAMRRKGDRLR